MLKKSKGLRLGAVAAAVTACLAFGSQAAYADPVGYPTLAGTGSDTTQDVLNGLASEISAIGSWNATDPADGTVGGSIQTRADGPSFVRPNGSGNGLQALSASINSTGTKVWQGVDVTGQLDFARSSSNPSSSYPGTDLTFIPFGVDTVTYAVNASSDFPRNLARGSAGQAAANPTALTLWNIYHCTLTSYTDAGGNAVPIIPLIPQGGSGTRSFWLGQVGLTEATIPSCVTDLNNTVQEHNGDALTDAGHIVPFSIAQYVAQGNHGPIDAQTGVSVTERRGHAALGSVNGIKATIVGANGTVANSAFPINRLVYNVVETARLSEPLIADTFVGANSDVCESAIVQQFGFAATGECGSTTRTSGYYL